MRAFLLTCALCFPGAALADVDRVAILAEIYAEHVAGVDGNELVMRDGTRFVIEDGRDKTLDQKIDDPDIADMLEQVYPLGECGMPPGQGVEPGRIRHEAFFRAVYGSTAQAVSATLEPVEWFGQELRVTRVMGVAERLREVRATMGLLGLDLSAWARPSAGTFNWRVIAGTDRLSVHSFGAAIDVNVEYANYWRWGGEWENRYPVMMVKIFEAQGFIWGGKWDRFDTMHFEYRPELIAISQALGGGC